MFGNIVDQMPGTVFGDRSYRLLATNGNGYTDLYLLMFVGTRCTVFAVDEQLLWSMPSSHYGVSHWEYLCRVCVPGDNTVKRLRFSVDLSRKLPQGARNFASSVSARFNFGKAREVLSALSGES